MSTSFAAHVTIIRSHGTSLKSSQDTATDSTIKFSQLKSTGCVSVLLLQISFDGYPVRTVSKYTTCSIALRGINLAVFPSNVTLQPSPLSISPIIRCHIDHSCKGLSSGLTCLSMRLSWMGCFPRRADDKSRAYRSLIRGLASYLSFRHFFFATRMVYGHDIDA
jgi:hypothetical protein